MTVAALPSIHDGKLLIRDKVVLNGVPSNVVVSQASEDSAFLGATSTSENSRHVFNLGILEGYKLLCLYRFKIWWMIPRFGSAGSDIPVETQFLLLEAKEVSPFQEDNSLLSTTVGSFYTLFLPCLEGPFRSSLQGTVANELQLCVESGDSNVKSSSATEAVLINSRDDPFDLITNSIKILEKTKGTFRHIEHKEVPAHLDWFGWCTWDAFYKDVSPQGIIDGLQSFQEGGCAPRFLIIDDGWQDTINEFQKEGEPAPEGSEFSIRLFDIKENKKFKDPESHSDLSQFIKTIKEKYGLKYVYMWHALAGYWGGVLPSSEAMKKYNPKLVYPIQSPGNIGNIRDIAMDSIEKFGVGVIDPKHIYEFYNDLHSYLARSGADGVKVDVQNLLETLGTGYGGRVKITGQYQGALEQSVANNFKHNNLICCMSHNSDCIYSSKMSAVARASEDFMPNEPTFQTLHIASVSFNSLLLGEIMVPDWDMFHSNHSTAEFHGAARALGGCAVYVSDKPGTQDFEILKKLVLPDGSILRAKHAGRPTRDCLFVDPVMDGRSLLKIWNTNKLSGVIGVFNCQGAGRWPCKDQHQESPDPASALPPLSGHVCPLDVEHLEDIAGENWCGDCALYAFSSGSFSRLSKHESMEVSLEILKCEIFTVSPIRVFGPNIHFAPLGLLDMYNAGGAVEALSCDTDRVITVKTRGCGRFGAYSNTKPESIKVDSQTRDFTYNAEEGLLTLTLQGDCCDGRVVEIIY
uniref:galactinol--sucrose galactosyltransferase n=1 Tax=Kalanchoe fedtschenkoi TaxID=63787 RepID=A0A7N0VEP6_KALFE